MALFNRTTPATTTARAPRCSRATRASLLTAALLTLGSGAAGIARADQGTGPYPTQPSYGPVNTIANNVSATAGVTFTGNTADFFTLNPADQGQDFQVVSLNWGDGTPTSPNGATVIGGNTYFDIKASHLYVQPGTYSITANITFQNQPTVYTVTAKALVSADAYPQAVLKDGPVGYWRLDGGAGPALDLSGHNLVGVAAGGVSTAPSTALADGDAALSFDGQSGFVSLGDPIILQPKQLSVEAWINTSSVPGSGAIIVRKRFYGYALSLDGSGKPHFTIDDQNATGFSANGAVSVADGHWHHLVGTYNGSQVSLYVDGALVDTEKAGTIFYGNDGIAIGRDGGYNGTFFKGSIDEVAIYPAALSATQVANHFAAR